jgi:hypothetical protein
VGRVPLTARVAAVSGAEGLCTPAPKAVKQVLYTIVYFLVLSVRRSRSNANRVFQKLDLMQIVGFDKVAGLCDLMKTAHEEFRNLPRLFDGL